uniref:Rho guanine nucleotide exchange factor (GEF) 1b n=1 Tax=Cyprinus carpio TaxID=7962 RepID=A0A8C1IYR4_CYPCA
MDCEDAHNGRGPSGAQCSNPAMNIIGAEDEDFENDEQPMVDDQCSHFNSIELLKSRPTHLLVFIHHVMLQFDCAPVLCYLHADLFKNFNAKDTKKHFGEFYNSFLEKGAILKISVPNNLSYELDRMRSEIITEEQQKRIANEIQFMQSPEILRQLDDFRQKRMMGMTPNERELNDVESHRPTDRIPMDMKEKAVAESLLEKMFEANPSIVPDKDKSNCIFGAVAFYMKHIGVKTRALDNKKTKSGWRPSVPSVLKPWGANKPSKIIKPPVFTHDGKQTRSDFEVKQTKSTVQSQRASISDGGTTPVRKPGVAGSGSTHGSESSEEMTISFSVTPSPDSQSDTGVNNNRSDPRPVSEGGDASPVSTGGGLSVCESPSVIDIPPDDIQDSGRSTTKEGLKNSLPALSRGVCCVPPVLLLLLLPAIYAALLKDNKDQDRPLLRKHASLPFPFHPNSFSSHFSFFCILPPPFFYLFFYFLFFTSVCLFLVPPDVLQCQSFLLAFSLQFTHVAVFLRIKSALCPAMLRQGM